MMRRARMWLMLASAVFIPAAPGAAQQIPTLPPGVTPEQALQALEQRPELGEIVRRQLQQSGPEILPSTEQINIMSMLCSNMEGLVLLAVSLCYFFVY